MLRAPRVEAGLRFIMVSLSVAAVAMAIPQFVITFVVPSTVLVPGLHLLLLPGIFLPGTLPFSVSSIASISAGLASSSDSTFAVTIHVESDSRS